VGDSFEAIFVLWWEDLERVKSHLKEDVMTTDKIHAGEVF
jgi:hypothetical protein